MPARLTFLLFFGALELRSRIVEPLRTLGQRLRIALASGVKRTALQADAALRMGDGLTAKRHWEELEKAQPQNPLWPVRIANVVRERGDVAAAERVLLDAHDRGIRNDGIELGTLRFGRLGRRSNAAVDEAEAVVADPAAPVAKVFHSAFYLTAQNRLDAARTGFERALTDANYGALARGQLAALDLLVQRRAAGKPDIPGWVSAAEESVLIREPSSDTLVVGFALPEGSLGLPLNAAHAMLSSKGVNALYLYDSQYLYHMGGTGRFGAGYSAMIDGIRALAAELGTRRLITLGGSATGFTALHAAIDLKADGVLVFSPLTMMLARAHPGMTRNGHSLKRLAEIAPRLLVNVRKRLIAEKAAPRIDVYYSATNRRDQMHASNLAPLPNVTLHPIPTQGRHDCLNEMAARGYRDLLRVDASAQAIAVGD